MRPAGIAAAVFFDLLIHSYSFSIKRIGAYVRNHIEPALTELGHMPEDFMQWQKLLTQPKTRQRLAYYGNFGLTSLICVIGAVSLFFPYRPVFSLPLLTALIACAVMDVAFGRSAVKLGKIWDGDPPSDA